MNGFQACCAIITVSIAGWMSVRWDTKLKWKQQQLANGPLLTEFWGG